MDDYINVHVTEHVNVNVKEHRAPTDDSIRLAKEYEDKAWEKVTKAITTGIPSIGIEYISIYKDHAYDKEHLFFKLNGKPIHLEIQEEYGKNKQNHLQHIANTIAGKVVELMLKDGYRG